MTGSSSDVHPQQSGLDVAGRAPSSGIAAAEIIPRFAPRSERRVEAGLVALAIALRLVLFFAGYLQTEIRRADAANLGAVFPTREALHDTIEHLRTGDSGWYRTIADFGYARRPFSLERQENWGFFPGWPLVIKAGAPLFGGTASAQLILANLASLAAIVLLYRLLRLDHAPGISAVAAGSLCVSPWAYHLMRGGAESIFLLTSVGAILAARRQRFVISALAGALAVLSRPAGIILFPVLLLLVAVDARAQPSPFQTFARRAVPLLLLPAAFAGFLWHLWTRTGNALAYFDMQRALWLQRPAPPLVTLGRLIGDPRVTDAFGWDLTLLSMVAAVAVLALVAAGGWRQARGRLRMRPEYWVYVTCSLLMVLSRQNLTGVGRYLLSVFPLFLLLALVLARRPGALLTFGAASVVLQSFLFTNLLADQSWAG